MTAPQAATRPPGRYGERTGPNWIVIIATAVMAVLFVWWIVATGWRLSHPAFTSTLQSYKVIDDQHVNVRWGLVVADPSRSVTCVVRARDVKSNEVGRASVTSETGKKEQILDYTLKTATRANLGEVIDCHVN